jgi:hypothetical protein
MTTKETNVYNSLIIDTIKEMIGLAKKGNFTAKQELNGVTVLVNGDSNADLIFRDQQRAQSGYVEGEVGPYPNPVLTDEDKASDARVEAENERKRQKRQAEYEKKARAHREKVEAKLANAPAIELTDEAGWQKFKDVNTDGYGGAVVTYAERWARLMQVEMANGKNLEDVADAASHEADLEGITDFMYGCAVSTLAACWKHGEQLRHWHNFKTQIGHEGEKANESGGVLNPALLSLG